jgi:L-threonylcarbamoyladenylate synthase
LAGCFWPGALTLVLPANERLPLVVRGGGATVGVRMPDHPAALDLLEAAGGALAVTSANLSGQPVGTTAQEVLEQLAGRIPLVLDGGLCPGMQASTVVAVEHGAVKSLRPGPINAAMVRECLESRTGG